MSAGWAVQHCAW